MESADLTNRIDARLVPQDIAFLFVGWRAPLVKIDPVRNYADATRSISPDRLGNPLGGGRRYVSRADELEDTVVCLVGPILPLILRPVEAVAVRDERTIGEIANELIRRSNVTADRVSVAWTAYNRDVVLRQVGDLRFDDPAYTAVTLIVSAEFRVKENPYDDTSALLY